MAEVGEAIVGKTIKHVSIKSNFFRTSKVQVPKNLFFDSSLRPLVRMLGGLLRLTCSLFRKLGKKIKS